MTMTHSHAPAPDSAARPVRTIITLAVATATIATTAVGRSAGAQDCRLHYERAAASAAEQLTIGADQVQELAPNAATAARDGAGVRALANRGSTPLALALVGASVPGVASTPGSAVVRAFGGMTGGVLGGASGAGPSTYGGAYGGVLGSAVGHVATLGGSWIVLQPGQHVEGLQHDLAAVACGAANPIARAIAAAGASR